MVDQVMNRFTLYCVAFLATMSGLVGHAHAEQLGDRTDVLEPQSVQYSDPLPRFELEAPATDVATVGAADSVAFLSQDDDELMSPMSKLDWDEPLVAADAVRRREAEAKPQRFEVTVSPEDVIPAEERLSQAPMPALSAVPQVAVPQVAVPQVSLEEIAADMNNNQEDSVTLSVNPEPSGKTLLAALLFSLVLIGGFTAVFRPRTEAVQPIQFH